MARQTKTLGVLVALLLALTACEGSESGRVADADAWATLDVPTVLDTNGEDAHASSDVKGVDTPSTPDALGQTDVPADGAGTDTLRADTHPGCQPAPPVADDAPRTVLLTHPYGATGSECGTTVERFVWTATGELERPGERWDVGDCPQRVAFSPDGRLVLVITNNGHDPQAGTQSVVVLRHGADGMLEDIRRLEQFSLRNPSDVVFSHDGSRAYVTDFNIEGEGGVHVLRVEPGCDAEYDTWWSLPLAQVMVVLPGDRYAFVVGGQNPNDSAVVDLQTGAVTPYDLFSDFVSAYGVALSPDGTLAAVPNASLYSDLANTVATVRLAEGPEGPSPVLVDILENVKEPSDIHFDETGAHLAVTTFTGNSVDQLALAEDGTLSTGGSVGSISLADRIAGVHRGPLADRFLVTAVTAIHVLRFTEDGIVQDSVLPLGEGSENMCGDIAVEP